MKIKLTFLFLLLCLVAKAQSVSPDNRIVVLGHATIDVPANQVKFVVTLLSIDSASVDKVYQKHQRQEDSMVKLLKELQIPAKNINYSLLTISQRQDYNNRQRIVYFAGYQTVIFTLNELSRFTEVQNRLIKDGFTSFRSSFTSTEMEKRQTEVLEKAIEVARAKADVMARAANRQVKRISKVADTEDTDPAFQNYRQSGILNEVVVRGQSSMSNLVDEFPQTIPVSAQVKVVFELK
ncbi:SIMPL domain-containing protein [Pontibacter fetidus]|uniref:SIMPL domain-containing protein n=1 Tax=Pontibacter fetidus TaxID=2700082 RepID=A0A6B2H9J2_9BACT|nr:SIMPL domain-containing protein [Pontibacter fetidus]NDK56202.1 SIMPL domain-containing protein [Pontibacter fetidus]